MNVEFATPNVVVVFPPVTVELIPLDDNLLLPPVVPCTPIGPFGPFEPFEPFEP